MDRPVAFYFRDQLREARSIALRDSEAFEAVVFALERIGVYLTGTLAGLGKFAKPLAEQASRSPLANEIPAELSDWHASFAGLYRLVKTARNDALHEGAYARHLTAHAVELSLVLEDALMENAVVARDFMGLTPSVHSYGSPSVQFGARCW